MKTAAEQYEQDRETFEAAEFEYNEARTVWTRDTQDGHYSIEIEWSGEAYNVQGVPYNQTHSIPDLDEDRATADEAIKVADDFSPGRSFDGFDRDDAGAPAGQAQHVTAMVKIINDMADVLEAHAVHGDHSDAELQSWATRGRAIVGNVPALDDARFDAVELASVIVYLSGNGEQEICEAFHSFEEYESTCEMNDVVRVVYSVYGHLTVGGVECLADGDTPEHARLLGAALANYWGVEVNDLISEIPAQ